MTQVKHFFLLNHFSILFKWNAPDRGIKGIEWLYRGETCPWRWIFLVTRNHYYEAASLTFKMGQTFSQINDDQEQQKIYRSMQKRLEYIKAKLYNNALNNDCLPIVCAVDKFHEFRLRVEDESEDRLEKKINKKT